MGDGRPGPEAPRAFLRRLLPAAVAAALIWVLLRPVLDSGVAGTAELLIRAYEVPRVTLVVAREHAAHVTRSDLRAGSRLPSIPLTQVHFNTIVLLALFLALPRPFSRRGLERLFMAWTLLFVIQSLNVFFHVKFTYATALGPWSEQNYSAFARNAYAFLQYFTDLPVRLGAPFVLWVAYNWDFVAGVLPLPPAGAEHGKRG